MFLLPNNDSVVPEHFLGMIPTLRCITCYQWIRVQQATSVFAIKKFLKECEIPLPPLPEQKRIAAILDAADALRAKRRESIEQLDSLIQSTFLEMFGDPVTNPKGWEVKSRFTRWDNDVKVRIMEQLQPGDEHYVGKSHSVYSLPTNQNSDVI